MAIAKNGAAIIDNEMVPASEVLVLRTLVGMDRPATVPEIASAMGDVMSDASLYSLLGRLSERRRLVARQAVTVNVHGTSLRRVVWSAHQAATDFFTEQQRVNAPSKAQPAGAPG